MEGVYVEGEAAISVTVALLKAAIAISCRQSEPDCKNAYLGKEDERIGDDKTCKEKKGAKNTSERPPHRLSASTCQWGKVLGSHETVKEPSSR